MGYDILLFDERDVYRVEVKSASASKKVSQHHVAYKPYSYCVTRGSRVKRLIKEDDADILALVASDIKAVDFMAVSSLTTVRVRRSANDFGNETESLLEAMRNCNG